MYLLQVTISATNVPQPIIPLAVVPGRSQYFANGFFQNNGSNNMRIGDSTVSSTKGILIGPGGGSQTIAQALNYTADMIEFWVNGTKGDKLDIMVLD